VENVERLFSGSEEESFEALIVKYDLVTVRLVTVEDGSFSAASNAGTRGVPGGVRSQS